MSVQNVYWSHQDSIQQIIHARSYSEVTSHDIEQASNHARQAAAKLVVGLKRFAQGRLGRFTVTLYKNSGQALPTIDNFDGVDRLTLKYHPYFINGTVDRTINADPEIAANWFAGLAYLSTTTAYKSEVDYALVEASMHDLTVSPPEAVICAWKLTEGVYTPSPKGFNNFSVREGWDVN